MGRHHGNLEGVGYERQDAERRVEVRAKIKELTTEVERLKAEHEAGNMGWRTALQGAKDVGLQYATERDTALAQLAESQATVQIMSKAHLEMENTIKELHSLLAAEKARADKLNEENKHLRHDLKGDYDLDAWLDWCTQRDQYVERGVRAERALREKAEAERDGWKSNAEYVSARITASEMKLDDLRTCMEEGHVYIAGFCGRCGYHSRA